MVNDPNPKDPDRWARLRFAIIGPLLAAPAAAGELKKAIQELAAKFWQHPVSGERVQFSFSSIERWFYAARKAQDPVAALRRQRRSDAGRQSLGEPLIRALRARDAREPIKQNEILIIYRNGHLYDGLLRKLAFSQIDEAGRYILAVPPSLSLMEVLKIKERLVAANVSITLLDDAWLQRLSDE